MQLVSKDIRLYDPMKSKVIGEKEVIEKFGVKTESSYRRSIFSRGPR